MKNAFEKDKASLAEHQTNRIRPSTRPEDRSTINSNEPVPSYAQAVLSYAQAVSTTAPTSSISSTKKHHNVTTSNPTSSKSFKHTTTVTPVPSNTPLLPSLAPFATQATMTRPSVIPRTTSSAPKSIDPTTQTTFAQKLSTASNDLCTIPPTSTLSHTQLQPPVSPKNWMSQLTNNPPTPKSPELLDGVQAKETFEFLMKFEI